MLEAPMTNLDDLERTILSEARAFIEPTVADEARILERLALGLGGVATISAIAAPRHGTLARLQRWLATRKAVALSCALLGAGAGFGAGFVVGHNNQRADVPSPARFVEDRDAESPRISAATPTAETPSDETKAVRAADESPAVLGSTPQSPVFRRTQSESNGSPLAVSDPIADELALLKRAERAIRARDSLLALGLLRELEQRFPRGKLLAERAAARVMAECQQQPPDVARRTGEAYLRGANSGVYNERVRRLCGISYSPSKQKGVSSDKDSLSLETNPDSRRSR
jgi:hypothetical protein